MPATRAGQWGQPADAWPPVELATLDLTSQRDHLYRIAFLLLNEDGLIQTDYQFTEV